MSRVSTTTVIRTGSIDIIPSGYTGNTDLTAGTGNYVPANGYHDHTYTGNYARWDLSASDTSTVCYVYYTFDASNIPSNATITSVTAQVKAYRNNRVTQSTCGVQLYANTTAKGTANVGNLTTSATTVSITDGGSWSRSDLNNLRLRIYGVRSNARQAGYLYFYGATITIEYTYPEEVQTTEYQVSISNSSSSSVSPSGTNNWVAEGGNQTITFTNVSDIATLSVVDNNVNVVSELIHTSGTTYTYTIEDIDADHTIVVSNVTAYNITASVDSSATGLATVSPASGRAGQGSDFSITIVPIDINTIKVYDNNSDVISSLVKNPDENTSITLNPATYTGGNGTITDSSNGLSGTDSSSYSQLLLRSGTYMEYSFDTSGIPYNATIISISCRAKGCVTRTSNAATVQLYSGTTAKGSTTNLSYNSEVTIVNLTCGEWTRNEISDIRIRISSTYTNTSNYYARFYGADLVIDYIVEGIGYTYTINNVQAAHTVVVREAPYLTIDGSSSLNGVDFTNLPKKIYTSGSSFTATISGITNPYSFRLSDNNNDVTNLVTLDGSFTGVPSEYLSGSSTPTNPNNALTDTNDGNYTQFTINSSQQEWFYKIDTSGIPTGTNIKSVSCRVRALCNRNNSTGYVQLYSGNNAKGSSTALTTTDTTHTLNVGTWTAAELQDCRLRINETYTSTTTSYYIRLWGAELIVEYEGGTYTISNITVDHTLVITEAPYYAVTGIVNFGTGFSGLSNKVYHGDSCLVTLLGITNPLSFKLYDNNVDVTSQVNTSNWEYTLTNVQEAHELRLEEATYYNVSGNSSFTGVSFSGLPSKVYDGDTLTFRLTGITNEYSFYLFDNGGDATASVDVANNYQIIYNNVHESHIFEIIEKPYYSVTTSSSFSGVTISGGSNKVYVGQEIIITISGATNIRSLHLEDNDVDVSQYIVESGNTFTYTILGVVEDHVLILSEADHHTVTATSNHSTATISVSPNSVYPGEGFVAEITIPDGTNPYSIKLLDNNEDVTHYIEYSFNEATYDVDIAPGATYGFDYDDNTGFYKSANAGIGNSAAVCRFTFNLPCNSRVTIRYINQGEYSNNTAYDYGILGNIDTALSTSNSADSNAKRVLDGDGDSSDYEETITYDISSGEHFIDFKFIKDSGVDTGLDSLQIKVDSIEFLEEVSSSITYSVESVSEDHTLLLTTEQICNITTSNSQYPSASLSVDNSSPYRYEPITITLNVSDISLVTVTATALSTTKAITGKFEEVSNGIYQMEYVPKGNTTIEVKQHIDYTVTATDSATNGTLNPTGTLTIEAGYDAEYKVTTDYLNRIYLKDDNVIVNDKLVYHQLQDGSVILYIDSSSNASSSGYTNFTTSTSNPISNAGDSSNDTSNYFRLRSTTSNGQHEAWLEFDTDSLNNIPSNINLSVTCKVAFRVSSTTYISALAVQLYSGNTAKGTATTTRTTTTTAYTLNIGNWTLEELQNARIRVTATHNNSTNNGDVRIYGCDLTVSWHEDEHYSYTIESISANHTILLQDRPTYQVTASSNVPNSTISPATQTIYEDNQATVTVSTDELFRLKLLDNGTKVTLMPSGNNYIYTIDSVMEAHTLLLDRLLSPWLKINNTWVDYSRIFKKINGIWVEQVTMEGVFEDGYIYMLNNL